MTIFRPGGHDKGHNSKGKVEKLSEGAKTTATAKATNGLLTKIAAPYQNTDFRTKILHF